MASTTATYLYASVVKTTVDDPTNDREAGTVLIEAGKCDDGVAYTVFTDEGFLEIECDVLEVFEADSPMSRENITQWAAQQAEESDVDYSSAGGD